MTILAYVVTFNEADRYVEQVLRSLREQVDGLCIYDDCSTDNTVEILKELRVQYRVRNRFEPSFVQDESLFRQDAWQYMEKTLHPRVGDWILTLDADEFLRLALPLRDLCAEAENFQIDGLWMHVHEMWEPDQIRVDRYWATIRALRLVAYQPEGRFLQRKQGGGSVPDYVKNTSETSQADILHYGYTKPEDRQAKYDRYSGTVGHSRAHIQSILQSPTLVNLPPLG